MKERCRAIFRGRVQGVHFRDYTKLFSTQQKVTGWVRNLSDGTVEAVFEGERANILEVVRLLQEEHPVAEVRSFDLIWSECRDEFRKFEIV